MATVTVMAPAETIIVQHDRAAHIITATESSGAVLIKETQVQSPILVVSPGPQGAKGNKGDIGNAGEGIDNFNGDPVLAYLLARG